MQLLFFLGNDLIDAVSLQPEKIAHPGYLGSFKRSLQHKYNYLIAEDQQKPEFLVMPQPVAESRQERA